VKEKIKHPAPSLACERVHARTSVCVCVCVCVCVRACGPIHFHLVGVCLLSSPPRRPVLACACARAGVIAYVHELHEEAAATVHVAAFNLILIYFSHLFIWCATAAAARSRVDNFSLSVRDLPRACPPPSPSSYSSCSSSSSSCCCCSSAWRCGATTGGVVAALDGCNARVGG